MDTWSLPKARPISCNDCPALQRHHMSIRWFAESFTLLLNLINTTFREKIYTRWCCIDRLSWHRFSECGPPAENAPRRCDRVREDFFLRLKWSTTMPTLLINGVVETCLY